MDDERTVASVGGLARNKRDIWVDVRGCERVRGDISVLAGEITDLAGLRQSRVTRSSITTLEWIEMARGTKTIPGRIYLCDVDMID
jgi:hypothetical protein